MRLNKLRLLSASGTCVIFCLLCITAIGQRTFASESQFYNHRARVQQGRTIAITAQGVIIHYLQDELTINLSWRQLTRAGFEEDDIVLLYIGGTKLRARLVSEDTFEEIVRNHSTQETMIVDIVCIARRDHVTVVGLGGGLTDWLNADLGMRVLIFKEAFAHIEKR